MADRSEDDSDRSSKRIKPDDVETALVPALMQNEIVAVSKPRDSNRTSNLEAPNMLLSGHESAIYSISFSPTGKSLASSALDGSIFLWEVFGSCKNYNVLEGHKNAVLELKWTEEGKIVSCSADKTVAVWDANKGCRLRKFSEHT